MSKPSVPARQPPQCEPLFELFSGSHGRVHAGHMLKGTDAGRIVTLRELSIPPGELASAVDMARSLAHPRLSKLGIVHGDAKVYVASEYTPGVSLLELRGALRQQHTQLKVAAAVRLVLDAVQAAAVAQRLLKQTANLGYTRTLFPDTIWVAEYGDVLLSEICLAPLLSASQAAPTEADAMARDVLTAGMEIFQLASGQLLTLEVASQLDSLPPPLARLLQRVLTEPESFDGPGGLAVALESLPPHLRGTEQQIADELRRVLGSTLKSRRSALAAARRSSSSPAENEITQVSRPSGVVAGLGQRPAQPAAAVANGTVEQSRPRSPAARRLLSAQSDNDELTTVFRPSLPSLLEGASAAWAEEPTIVDRVTPPPESDAAFDGPNPFRPRAPLWLSLSLLLLLVAALGVALTSR
jgi:hypothetical protein